MPELCRQVCPEIMNRAQALGNESVVAGGTSEERIQQVADDITSLCLNCPGPMYIGETELPHPKVRKFLRLPLTVEEYACQSAVAETPLQA